jgi:hypothetical protein
MAVRLSALRAGRPLTPRKIPGTHLCWRLSAMLQLEGLTHTHTYIYSVTGRRVNARIAKQ